MNNYFDAATFGMQDAREYIRRLDVERLRDVTIGELEEDIYTLAGTHELDNSQREEFKRAFIRELCFAIFYIY